MILLWFLMVLHLRIVQEAAERLSKENIDCEIIDVQTLLPFDIHHLIVASLKKTNRIVFIDEDVPGGATALYVQRSNGIARRL
jgi:pyruvate/2-oxoglutarate/acetoin dehydrogenase E1 component